MIWEDTETFLLLPRAECPTCCLQSHHAWLVSTGRNYAWRKDEEEGECVLIHQLSSSSCRPLASFSSVVSRGRKFLRRKADSKKVESESREWSSTSIRECNWGFSKVHAVSESVVSCHKCCLGYER